MSVTGSAVGCGAARSLMRLVTMSGEPILRQLYLEEPLLRRTTDNWPGNLLLVRKDVCFNCKLMSPGRFCRRLQQVGNVLRHCNCAPMGRRVSKRSTPLRTICRPKFQEF